MSSKINLQTCEYARKSSIFQDNQLIYMETYKPAYAIKLSAKNFGFEDNKKTVPLYAAFCI